MTTPRILVYIAWQPFVKDDINAWTQRLALDSHWAVAKYPEHWERLGTVDADGAAYIEMLRDAATLPRLLDRITPIGVKPPAPQPSHRGPGRPGWTPDLFRRRWSEAIERGQLPEPATYRSVAPYFEMLDGTIGDMDPGYLGKLVRKYGVE